MSRAPRITQEKWVEARAKREAGEPLSDIARWLQVDRALVSKRAKREGWGDGADLESVIHRKVTEKITGIVTGCDPKKQAEALDAVASRRADVEIRHQTEWDEHKLLLDAAIGGKDFEMAKLAKITSETLKIRQEGERKAWRLDVTVAPPVQITNSQVFTQSPEEYEQRARRLTQTI